MRGKNNKNVEYFDEVRINYTIGFFGLIMGGIILATLTSADIIKINFFFESYRNYFLNLKNYLLNNFRGKYVADEI